MTNTTYYNLNIVEGTDIVNPLTVDNPNYEKIDEAMHDNAVAGVTLATEIANATVHAITRENSECAVIRFIATSVWKAGDTVTVDGVPVTALLPSGETLPDGAYVINANVLCILTGTNLTIYAERKNTENANAIAYNSTTVGSELTKLNSNLATVENTKLLSNVSVLSITKNGRYYIAGALDLPSGVNVFGYLDVHNYDDSGINRKITWTPVNSNITYINIKNDTWIGWDSFALNSSMPVWALNNHELGFSLDTNNKKLGVWVDGDLIGNISF